MAKTVSEARNILELKLGKKLEGGSLTYSFLNFLPDYYVDGKVAVYNYDETPLNSQTKTAIRGILNEISELTGIDFREREHTDVSVGDIKFGYASITSMPGFTFAVENDDPRFGDIWISSSSANNPVPPISMLRHELLHVFGFGHPVQYGSGLPFSTSDGPAPYFENDPGEAFTLASYEVEPNGLLTGNNFQLYDIALLQHLYGVNNETRDGDDVYGPNLDSSTLVSLWDGGGNDTLSAEFAINSGNFLDLRQGYFSTIINGEHYTSPFDNVSIAFGAEIENATGSKYDDFLIGNSLSNVLIGGQGDDVIAGDETGLETGNVYFSDFKRGVYYLEGQINGSKTSDTFIGGPGNDVILGSNGTKDTSLYGVDIHKDIDLGIILKNLKIEENGNGAISVEHIHKVRPFDFGRDRLFDIEIIELSSDRDTFKVGDFSLSANITVDLGASRRTKKEIDDLNAELRAEAEDPESFKPLQLDEDAFLLNVDIADYSGVAEGLLYYKGATARKLSLAPGTTISDILGLIEELAFVGGINKTEHALKVEGADNVCLGAVYD